MSPLPRKNPSRYVAVADDLRKRIRDGDLAPGEDLPPEGVLSLEYNIGRGTVRSALDILHKEGIISKGQGRATRVRPLRKNRDKILIPVDGTSPAIIGTRAATSAERKLFGEGVNMLILQRPGQPEQVWRGDVYEFELASKEDRG